MTLDEALKEFGGTGYKLCKALGIATQNYTRWSKQGWIARPQQLLIERMTEGRLKADEFGPDRRPINLSK